MKKIMILITIIFLSLILSAEEFEHALGFTGGMISGSGFSYRRMKENYGYQVAFGAITMGDTDDTDFEDSYEQYWWPDTTSVNTLEDEGAYWNANIGVSYYKHLHKGENSTFYCLLGTAAYMDFGAIQEQNYEYNEDLQIWETSGEPTENNEFNVRAHFGFGIGIDYKLTENIRLNLDWPFVFSKYDDNFDIIMYIPQAGIHYYFK